MFYLVLLGKNSINNNVILGKNSDFWTSHHLSSHIRLQRYHHPRRSR